MSYVCTVCETPTSDLPDYMGRLVCRSCTSVFTHAGKEKTIPLIRARIAWEERMLQVVGARPFGHKLSVAHTSVIDAYKKLLGREHEGDTEQTNR